MDDIIADILVLAPTEEEMERWFILEQTIDVYETVDKHMFTD